MKLIVGLGNIGKDYELTRHNIGFITTDAIFRRYSFSNWQEKFKGSISSGNIDGEKIIILKPATYMNKSGESVQLAMNFYKVTPEDVTVIHDDIDLDNLVLKVKRGGSNAGHNGLKSISNSLGTDNYQRVRIGVGHPRRLGLQQSVSDYVLNRFSKDELPEFEDLSEEIAGNITEIIEK